jgi:hypothetical protein
VTALDGIQHPPRPAYHGQGPDSNCIITVNGVAHLLGWESCSAYSMATKIARATSGRSTPSGCSVRRMTTPLDYIGGLTLTQVAKVARDQYGIAVSVYVGSQVVSPAFVARQLRAGRPVVMQGNAAAMVGTTWQSTAGDVNHAVFINEVRGGTLDEPAEALVYDPAADGRKRSYHVDQGPSWWPWSLVKKFASYLRPAGDGAPRLGPGKVYCGIGPDTEPHVSLLKGATQAHPFPDRVRAADPNNAVTSIHNKPGGGQATVIRRVKNGTLLRLYQYIEGEIYRGDRTWGVNDDGTEFVHFKNITHEMGPT